MPLPRLIAGYTAILVVDMQEKLLAQIHEAQAVERQVARLLEGARVLGLPVVVTEQYRKGLGPTVTEVARRLPAETPVHEKLQFSALIAPVREELVRRSVRSVLVCGIEAHVCVLQTCLDLCDSGFVSFLAVDAIGSRRPMDRDVAIQRVTQAGVVPTTVESALLDVAREAGGQGFKELLAVIK
jgi:nicotinamidase-related amidase